MGPNPYKNRKCGHTRAYAHTGERSCEDREKTAIYTPRREASEGISTADTLIWDFQPPGLWDSQWLFCELHRLVLSWNSYHTDRAATTLNSVQPCLRQTSSTVKAVKNCQMNMWSYLKTHSTPDERYSISPKVQMRTLKLEEDEN